MKSLEKIKNYGRSGVIDARTLESHFKQINKPGRLWKLGFAL